MYLKGGRIKKITYLVFQLVVQNVCASLKKLKHLINGFHFFWVMGSLVGRETSLSVHLLSNAGATNMAATRQGCMHPILSSSEYGTNLTW
jgi:hypothetical protein